MAINRNCPATELEEKMNDRQNLQLTYLEVALANCQSRRRLRWAQVAAYGLLIPIGLAWGETIADRSYYSATESAIVGRSVDRGARKKTASHAVLEAARRERTERYAVLIDHYSNRHGLDPNLVRAVIYTESGGDAEARSAQGAVGLMQLMPATARELGVADRTNPEQSIAAGTRYLGALLDRFGSPELALWAYNAGPSAVTSGRMPAETQAYVPRVLRVRKLFEKRPRGIQAAVSRSGQRSLDYPLAAATLASN